MKIYSETYKIAVHDIDFANRMALPALGNCMLNIAENHATTFGFGLCDLQKRHLSWVISRMHFDILRYPKLKETIMVSTWVVGCSHFVSPRHFRITDNEGNTIAKASSLWSIIDLNTRRPIDMLKNADLTPFVADENLDIDEPIRIAETTDIQPIDARKVRYSDLDLNRHTNSMRYIQWILDTLELDQLLHNQIRKFDINYLHEIRPNDKVKICKIESQNQTIFEIKSLLDNRTSCKAKITL